MRLNMGARHALVALSILILAGLTGAGCVGPAVGEERFHSFDVTAIIRDDDTVSVREVIDYDFGGEERRGIFRLIPNDGGAPANIRVTSETAPDDLQVTNEGTDTRIRVGDPNVTISGRHRYVLTYTLRSTIVGGTFALDAIGAASEVPVTNGHVTILGAELTDPRCFTGPPDSIDRCELTEVDGGYEASREGIPPYEGITIDGAVASVDPDTSFPDELPPFEERDPGVRLRWAGLVALLGAITALAVFVISRQMGRNEVAAGGATEAAFVPFGQETFGTAHRAPENVPEVRGQMVADSKMAELAGIEFVPPGGIEPWQASVVLRETIDDRTIGAWFSGLAAHDILVIDKDGEDVRMRPGPAASSADAITAPILNKAMVGGGELKLGTYSPTFSAAWQEVGDAIDGWVVSSHVFRRRPPRFGAGEKGCLAGLTGLVPFVLIGILSASSSFSGGLTTAFAAVALAIAVPGVVAMIAYRRLIRSLTAKGSAIALRTEAFRRFLHDSEAQHVEWAWQNDLLREYSAWAVALGEVDAWNRAMALSAVPPVEQQRTSGVLAPTLYASSFSSTTTAPSSSGSGGGGGGFSGGGSVGGGGGGGGGGSW